MILSTKDNCVNTISKCDSFSVRIYTCYKWRMLPPIKTLCSFTFPPSLTSVLLSFTHLCMCVCVAIVMKMLLTVMHIHYMLVGDFNVVQLIVFWKLSQKWFYATLKWHIPFGHVYFIWKLPISIHSIQFLVSSSFHKLWNDCNRTCILLNVLTMALLLSYFFFCLNAISVNCINIQREWKKWVWKKM